MAMECQKMKKKLCVLFRLAADSGYSDAYIELGICHQDGVGVEKNEE